MSDSEKDSRRDIDYEQLNILGKAVFLTGAAVRTTTHVVDRAIHRAAGIVADSERAFREGLDPNMDDANILEERDEGSETGPSA